MSDLELKLLTKRKTLSFAEFDASVPSDCDVSVDDRTGEQQVVGTWQSILDWRVYPSGTDVSVAGEAAASLSDRSPNKKTVVSSVQSSDAGQPFSFSSFDPIVDDEIEEISAEPVITQEDVDAAHRAGVQVGIQQGVVSGEKRVRESLEKAFAKAVEENDAAIDKMFHQLADQFEFLFEQQQQRLEQSSEMMLNLTTHVWQQLMPEYVKVHGESEVVAVVKDSLRHMREGSVIIVHYAQANAETLEKMLASLQKIYQGRLDVVLEADASLDQSDVKLSWRGGGAERNMYTLMQEVDSLVKQAIEHFHQQRKKEQEAINKEQSR